MPTLPQKPSSCTPISVLAGSTTVACRVSTEERERLQEEADAAGVGVSELVKRRVLGEAPALDRFELMAAELRAMRMIICSLVAAGLRGDKLEAVQVQAIVRQADELKYAKGKEAVVEFVAAKKGVQEDVL